jgi:PAS domain S-box-containing protein
MPPNPPEIEIEADCFASSSLPVQKCTSTLSHFPLKFKRLSQLLGYPLQDFNSERVTELEAEIASLRSELDHLRQEKTDLEILLDATAEHSDVVEAELHSTAIAALKQSEEMFRTIAEAAPVPILVSRLADGTILYANASASQMFGIPIKAFSSRKTLEFYYDLSDRQRLLEQVERTGSVQGVELQCQRDDRSLLWVTASLQKLVFQEEPALLVALCDITQRKAEEEALKRQVQDMQIEIDRAKCEKQVADIVQSDYFKQIQTEVERLRYSEEEF